eukprot:GHVU01161556.1.p1 GENE.GHVU01161556.1~~GHVU01161556.1.p1  ORF type:complete len:183 (+),score=26.64 GHVU01161556.1:95-643(+)
MPKVSQLLVLLAVVAGGAAFGETVTSSSSYRDEYDKLLGELSSAEKLLSQNMKFSEFKELRRKLKAEGCKVHIEPLVLTDVLRRLKNCTETVRRKVLEEKLLSDLKDEDYGLLGSDVKDLDAARIKVLKLLKLLTNRNVVAKYDPQPTTPMYAGVPAMNVSTYMNMDTFKRRLSEAREASAI